MLKYIIAPAKNMEVVENYYFECEKPKFLNETTKIYETLKKMDYENLKNLWGCNDKIASLNYDRLAKYHPKKPLSPALFTYIGIQYKYLGADVLMQEEITFLKDKLFILSGLYGLLKINDEIIPYRLEAQAKLHIENNKNLYDFWGDKLAKEFKDDTIINLASEEYAKLIRPYIDPKKFIDIIFYEQTNKQLKIKATLAKMARGSMMRYVSQNRCENIEDLKSFNDLGFSYNKELSNENTLVFVKNYRKITQFDF